MHLLCIFILCLYSCNDKLDDYKQVELYKTQKVKIQQSWHSEYKLSYLWSKPLGPDNHNSSWIINNDIMLFTPKKTGKYIIEVSIENSMGHILGSPNAAVGAGSV